MWVILLAIALATWIYFIAKSLKFWEERGIPSLKPWPLVGNLGDSIFQKRAMAYVLDDIYKAFPERRYVGLYDMTTPTLMLRDPELIKRISVKEADIFQDHRPFIPEEADPLWSKNLFAMRGGEKWHDMRATLSPSFTSSKMKMMFELMKECSKQFSNHYLKKGGIVTLDMKDAFTRFANDVIATTAFGVTCDSFEHRENEFYLMGKEATTFTGIRNLIIPLQSLSPTLAKFLQIPLFTKAVKKFFTGVINETLKIREEQGIVRPDMIHMLMEGRKERLKHQGSSNDNLEKRKKAEITNEDITAHALGFFFAGFESVSTMMSYASYELAVNPAVQEKLRKEVDEALEKSKGEITYEILMEMKYLDMVVNETLRKWPSFAFTDRKSVRPFTIEPEQPGEKPLHLETGAVCFIPIYSIQRDPQYYPNPDKFDPERFGEANKHNIKMSTFLTFGSGPRNCLGLRFSLLEGKIAIVEIISKFEIVTVEKTPIPIILGKKNFNPLPDEGFWLGLKPRNKAF